MPAALSRAWAWRSMSPRRCADCSRNARCSRPRRCRAAELLDLVALGTVADVVPFDINNRILVAQGLQRIRAGRCVPGITALLEVARRTPSAPDRRGSRVRGRAAAQCSRPPHRHVDRHPLPAQRRASRRRVRSRSTSMSSTASGGRSRHACRPRRCSAVQVLRDPRSGVTRAGVCLFDAGWHQGVVGLVASRVKERLRRPVIAFAQVDERTLRGSARSMAGVHVRDVLDAIAARVARTDPQVRRPRDGRGPHARASPTRCVRARLRRRMRARARVARLARCHRDRRRARARPSSRWPRPQALRAGGPWGPGFPEPLFDGVFHIQSARLVASGT